MKDDNIVYLSLRLPCDFCKTVAEYDARSDIFGGRWAYMCKKHFIMYGVGLGLGKGQKIIYDKEVSKHERSSERNV